MKLWLNSIGIILNIAGALILLLKSPVNFSGIVDQLGVDDSFERETSMKNNMMYIGGAVVIFGSVLQLISNFVAG